MKKKVINNEMYIIFKNGDILRKKDYKYMSHYTNSMGYKFCVLGDSKNRKTTLVHRLLAQCFISNPNNYPVVNHIDGNPLNNSLSNLEWCTQQYNMQHFVSLNKSKGIFHRQGTKNGFSKLEESHVLKMRDLYSTGNYTYDDLSKLYDINISAVAKIIKRENWKHI